jgi:hypothetical protein
MACQSCNSERIIDVGAKCSDMFWATLGSEEHNGYVLGHIGIGSGDYVEFSYCADCGHIQGTWPLPENISLKEEDE